MPLNFLSRANRIKIISRCHDSQDVRFCLTFSADFPYPQTTFDPSFLKLLQSVLGIADDPRVKRRPPTRSKIKAGLSYSGLLFFEVGVAVRLIQKFSSIFDTFVSRRAFRPRFLEQIIRLTCSPWL